VIVDFMILVNGENKSKHLNLPKNDSDFICFDVFFMFFSQSFLRGQLADRRGKKSELAKVSG
jgi:hypothetical protein